MSVELEGGGGGGGGGGGVVTFDIIREVVFFPKILLKFITNDVNIYNIISGVFLTWNHFR